jgi:ketosteroid isomerase-like protein
MRRSRILTLTTRYADLFGRLTPNRLDELGDLLSPDVVFTDPFNVIEGPAQFIAVFEHMFEVMVEPRFHIEDISASDKAGYIKWRMTGRLKKKPDFTINIIGMSEVTFAADGTLLCHIDHWDSASQLLSRLPVVGLFVRKLMRLFEV